MSYIPDTDSDDREQERRDRFDDETREERRQRTGENDPEPPDVDESEITEDAAPHLSPAEKTEARAQIKAALHEIQIRRYDMTDARGGIDR